MQLKTVEKMLLEEAPSALFPFEKDILTCIVMDLFKLRRSFTITKIKFKFINTMDTCVKSNMYQSGAVKYSLQTKA
jgi:hypothetical protein